jgi:hypothetical protein
MAMKNLEMLAKSNSLRMLMMQLLSDRDQKEESQTDAPDKAHERMSICLLLIVKGLSVVMCDAAVVAFW